MLEFFLLVFVLVAGPLLVLGGIARLKWNALTPEEKAHAQAEHDKLRSRLNDPAVWTAAATAYIAWQSQADRARNEQFQRDILERLDQPDKYS